MSDRVFAAARIASAFVRVGLFPRARRLIVASLALILVIASTIVGVGAPSAAATVAPAKYSKSLPQSTPASTSTSTATSTATPKPRPRDCVSSGYVLSGGTLSLITKPAGGIDAPNPLARTPLVSGLPAASGFFFGVDGYLYLWTRAGLARFDPTTGAALGPVTRLADGPGCGAPYLIAAATSGPNGTAAPGDQFSASIRGGAIVTGSAGPLLARPGPSYAVNETMSSGDPAAYAIGWSCRDAANGNAVIASGDGPSGAFTLARAATGADVTCTFTNTALAPASLHTTAKLVSVNGAASPASGVTTGDVLSYRITVTNSGERPGTTTLRERVPANTSYSGSGEAWSFSGIGAAGIASVDVDVAGGASVVTSFTVTVGALPTNTRSIDDRVTTSSGPCAGCTILAPTAAVLATGAQLVGVNGAAVTAGQTVEPGDVLQYQLTTTNTGGTDAAPVITEPVPANASYTGPATEGWTLVGATATRSLTVSAGATATATFTVTIDNPLQLGTASIVNTASISAGTCSCQVATAVPAYAVSITASAAHAHPGDTVRYTILVRNNGAADYTAANPAIVTDDLAGILDDAGYNNDATRDGTLAGTTLSWRLALPAGALVAITFSVTIGRPDLGDQVLVDSVATPADGGGNCPTGAKDPDCSTNAVGLQAFTVALSASASVAHPGDVVSYTIAVVNTGAVAYTAADPATFSVDLASILDDAAYRHDATEGGEISGNALRWSIALPVGAMVSVTFSVQVNNPDAGDNQLIGSVRSAPGDGGNCAPPSATCDVAPVLVQAYTVTMTASAGIVRPGDRVTYTVTATNHSARAYSGADLTSVVVDLSGLLDDATYGNDASAGASYRQPRLAWAVALPVGASTSFSFAMSVKAAGSGDGKLVGAFLTAVGGNCPSGSVNPECAPGPAALQAYTTVLAANRSGATNGDRIDYATTIRNAGTVPYTSVEPARVSDDLSRVLDDASFDGVSGGAALVGQSITWAGPLPVGASVALAYSVTVNSRDAGDGVLASSLTTPAGLGANCAADQAPLPACVTTVLVSSLQLSVAAVPIYMRDPGDVVTYAFTLTNTGHFSLAGLHLASVDFSGTGGAPELDACTTTLSTLAPGAVETCRLNYSVSAADIDAGVITAAAVVAGRDSVNPLVRSAISTALINLAPAITVSMRAVTIDVNGDGFVDPGDRVNWVISARNTGVSGVRALSVSDTLLGRASCADTELARDAVTDCTVEAYTIPASAAGTTVINSAIATGEHANGYAVAALPASYQLRVFSPPSTPSELAPDGTLARLTLIVIVTLIGFGALFVAAGRRSRRVR